MKCARVHLQERPRTKSDIVTISDNKPRRYCQKRMVDPAHDEDPRWYDVMKRFHCKNSFDYDDTTEVRETIAIEPQEDLFLSVQNLKFQGETTERKRPRTSFKYKSLRDNKKHRMFVKQIVEDIQAEEDASSQLTSYYFDDYVKYILSNDRSRPTSSKSSLFLQGLGNKRKENKSIQVGAKPVERKNKQNDSRDKKIVTKVKQERDDEDTNKTNDNNMEDAKIAFHQSGKRKSLTISRVPSPETVQVIRVDVVCNYNTSSILSDYYDDNKNKNKIDDSKIDKIGDIKFKSSHFANKYLLTNTVKTLDAKVSGGAKVTLLCKTFKLSDRSKLSPDRKNTTTIKNESKSRLR